MAFTSSETKAVIAYNNKVIAANVTAVTLSNASADSSFPVANLKYDDPWRMLKVTGNPSNNPTIVFQFAVAQSFTCLGLVNHNLLDGGYSVDLAYSADNVSYTSVGTVGLTTNANILLRFAASPARVYWRLTLQRSTPWQPFYLGSVFLGTHQALTTNPVDGGMNTRLSVPIDVIESAGEARHIRFGPTKYTQDSEITFERISQTMLAVLVEGIIRPNLRRQIAIIGPDIVHLVTPGSEHLFAYVKDVVVAPREGASTTTHRADVVLNLLGVM